MDIHVNDLGKVTRVINRPVTAYDYELIELRKSEKAIEKKEVEQGKRPSSYERYL